MFESEKCWETPSHSVKLEDKDVHVWFIQTHSSCVYTDSLLKILSEDELNKANRFRFDRDRGRYIFVRGTVRVILGHYTDSHPGLLKFTYNSYGKPFLATDTGYGNLFFNVSHSQDLALVAISHARRVGVDVEFIRSDISHIQIAESHFSEKEMRALLSLSEEKRLRGFFDCWTRKEAYIKARGYGLSLPLQDFSVTLRPEEPALIIEDKTGRDSSLQWFLTDLPLPQSYAGAVAIEGSCNELKLFRWSPFVIY